MYKYRIQKSFPGRAMISRIRAEIIDQVVCCALKNDCRVQFSVSSFDRNDIVVDVEGHKLEDVEKVAAEMDI